MEAERFTMIYTCIYELNICNIEVFSLSIGKLVEKIFPYLDWFNFLDTGIYLLSITGYILPAIDTVNAALKQA